MGRIGRIEEAILNIQSQIQNLTAGSGGPPIPVGWVMWLDDYIAPAAAFPYFCLSNDNQILTAAKWPLLVPHWRNKSLVYMPGTASAKSELSVVSYSVTSNVVTLTLAALSAETAIVTALAEDNIVHGSFSDWKTVTIPAIGAILAGTYDITAISAANRTVSFAYTTANVSTTTISSTVKFYSHRLPSAIDTDNTQARHFKIVGRTIVAPNDADGECIASLRRRDRFTAHGHTFGINVGNTANAPFSASTVLAYRDTALNYFGFASKDANNTTEVGDAIATTAGAPRTGKTTDPRSVVLIPYIYGGQYVE